MTSVQDVFISYGRADSKAFAQKLYQHLTAVGLKVWFDFEDIPLGVDFQSQIDDGIEKADNFLFLIAPHSVNSPYCLKEIQLALKRHKRIIPILHVESISREIWQQRNPNGADEEWDAYQAKGLDSSFPNMHPDIGKINWVYMREGLDDFDQSFTGLLELLERHRPYVRQHTSLLIRALEWEQYQHQTHYLLRGAERQQAQDWLDIRFKAEQAPCTPTDLHCEYITEGIKYADDGMAQVFMAHATEDQQAMAVIRPRLWREGFTVWTPTNTVKTGETLSQAMQRGIEQADAIIALISPDSLESESWQWQLDYAYGLNKRIIPVLVRYIPLVQLPKALRGLQFIDCAEYVKAGRDRRWEQDLIRLLRGDVSYYRTHKQLLVKALAWQQQQQNPSMLLRGHTLQQAQSWIQTANKRRHLQPTSLQNDFVVTSTNQSPEESLDVFISYCEVNTDIGSRLNNALQSQGKSTWFDQSSIPSDIDARTEIQHGIELSDNVLLVLTPESLQSQTVRDDLDYSISLNKRVLAAVFHGATAIAAAQKATTNISHDDASPAGVSQLDASHEGSDSGDTDAGQGRGDLAIDWTRIDWIDFNPETTDFDTGFGQLIRALETDREYVHSHTKWSQRSLEWEEKGKSHDLLLRGNEFAVAQAWLNESIQEKKRPVPTPLQQDFITSSQVSIETGIQRKKRQVLMLKALLGLVSVALVAAVGAGGIALLQYQKAERSSLLALTGKSDALFLSNQPFEALLSAMDAGQILKNHAVMRQNDSLKAAIATSLLNAFLWTQENNQLMGHTDGIKSVAFSPSGDRLVTAGADQTVKLWQANGLLQVTLEGHNAIVRDVAWHPTGDMIASAGDDGRIKLWRQDGVILRTFRGHTRAVYAVSFSPDGQQIASASGDGTVSLWSIDGLERPTILEHGVRVRDVAWSPDGQQLVTVSSDRLVRVWTRDGIELARMEGHTNEMEAVAWSANGELIASASRDRTVKLWTPTGDAVATLDAHRAGIEDVAFSPNGQWIATASDDSTVNLWSIDGRLLTTLTSHDTTATGVSFSPDSQTLATSSWDQSVRLWALDQSKVWTLAKQTSVIQGLQFSPDAEVLASVHSDRSVNFWNMQGEQLIRLNNAHDDDVLDVSFSPDGRTLVTASKDQTIKIWNWRQKIRQRTIAAHSGPINSVAVSPDGDMIATASGDRTMKLWRRDNGTLLETFAGHIAPVHHVSWHPDDQLLATASADGTVMVWGLEGIAMPPLRGHTDEVYSVDWSPDGQLLATASADNTVRLWTRSGILKQTLKGHTHKVVDVKFSPDGNTIVSASVDKTIKLWALDGTELATLKGHADQVSSLDFRPDGQVLASAAAYDRQVIFWNWNLMQRPLLDNLLDHSCTWMTNYLQRTSHIPDASSPVPSSTQRPSTLNALCLNLSAKN